MLPEPLLSEDPGAEWLRGLLTRSRVGGAPLPAGDGGGALPPVGGGSDPTGARIDR